MTGQKPRLRIIGDVHGKIDWYKRIISEVTHSVQLGDMGFASHYERLKDVDSTKHVFVPGTHDEYPNLPSHALGRYGVKELNGVRFFFIAGAESIDRLWRKEGKEWWPEEELSPSEVKEALELYIKTRPNIVVSHDCPSSVLPLVKTLPIELPVSRTQRFLQEMWEAHPPEYWFFGHRHRSRKVIKGRTLIICVGGGDYIDLY